MVLRAASKEEDLFHEMGFSDSYFEDVWIGD